VFTTSDKAFARSAARIGALPKVVTA